MIDTQQFLGFALAAFILIAIPGPSVVFVIGRALAYGRGTALASVLGNSLGLLVVLVLVAVGLGPLVTESAAVFTVLKLAGAAFLIWLGIRAIRDRRSIHVDTPDVGLEGRDRSRPTPLQAIRQGWVVGFSNPKAFIIFAAVLPQFIDRPGGHAQLQMFQLGLVAFVIGLLSDSLWAVGASQLRHWFNGSPRRGRALGAFGGISMVGLGVAIAVTGRPDST